MEYRYTRAALSALEGLAYRIADSAYMVERYGRDGAAAELEQNEATVYGLLDELDRLQVPHWVQNAAIFWAQDWRRYKSGYLRDYLNTRNIIAA